MMIHASGRNRTEHQMADDTWLAPPRPSAALQTSGNSLTPDQKLISAALTEAAIMRDAEASGAYLRVMATRLSTESVDIVLRAIRAVGEAERRQGEPGLPSLGRILAEIRRYDHPLALLRELVTRLARVHGRDVDEPLLEAYQDALGHRIDADIQAGYRVLMKDETLLKMPTPGRFLLECGPPRLFRDGSKPE